MKRIGLLILLSVFLSVSIYAKPKPKAVPKKTARSEIVKKGWVSTKKMVALEDMAELESLSESRNKILEMHRQHGKTLRDQMREFYSKYGYDLNNKTVRINPVSLEIEVFK